MDERVQPEHEVTPEPQAALALLESLVKTVLPEPMAHQVRKYTCNVEG